MSKHYPISDSCTSITIGGIVYNTVLSDTYECEKCDLRELCEESQDGALSFFCAIYVDSNHYFKKVK